MSQTQTLNRKPAEFPPITLDLPEAPRRFKTFPDEGLGCFIRLWVQHSRVFGGLLKKKTKAKGSR